MIYAFAQSIIVYMFLAIVMVVFGKAYSNTKSNKYLIGAIVIYSIIFGIRYGVGGDFFVYREGFQCFINKIPSRYEIMWEPGFNFFVKLLSFFRSPEVIFAVIAFSQLFLTIWGVKEDAIVIPFIFFAFIFSGTWLSFANGLRQILAFGCWVLAVKYATEKRILLHYVLLLLAISLHHSAIVLLPFYFIICHNKDWFNNQHIQLFLLGLSLILMNVNVVQSVVSRLDDLITVLGYSNYLENYSEKIEAAVHIGPGFYFTLITNIIIIYYSNLTKEKFNNAFYIVLYNLFFLGILFSYVFINSQLFARFNLYFYSLGFIVIGYTLCALKQCNNNIPYYSLLIMTIFTFVSIMYRADQNWALFIFSGQESLYYLHYGHMIV